VVSDFSRSILLSTNEVHEASTLCVIENIGDVFEALCVEGFEMCVEHGLNLVA
jgi:hypothetical protein